ncbi:hypothetical protein [Paenibacillus arenilitoris]|uniref:Uncharacterized protein n=1 Tax=Paenibacillus arenilitoris TaxID=2772299 RepID=A0A927H791_9BACL|nr:hypothetical protein [Paenibacillus arenilitoris]MBD2870408.1 hypothetical protein [Paenibacillus arenilitoris]
MFKQVENATEAAFFNDIWTSVWKEKGYELEYSDQPLAQYVIVTPDGHFIGTSEINRFDPRNSSVLQAAALPGSILAAAEDGLVAEIDKIALLKPYRGKYLSDLLSSIVYFADRHHYRYFVSLLEPVFYRALRVSFHIPMERLGGESYYKGDYVIPVLFETNQMYVKMPMFYWLKYPS